MATVAQIMNKHPESVGPTTSVRGAAKKMRELRVHAQDVVFRT